MNCELDIYYTNEDIESVVDQVNVFLKSTLMKKKLKFDEAEQSNYRALQLHMYFTSMTFIQHMHFDAGRMFAHTLSEFSEMDQTGGIREIYAEEKLRKHVEHYHCDLKHVTIKELGHQIEEAREPKEKFFLIYAKEKLD